MLFTRFNCMSYKFAKGRSISCQICLLFRKLHLPPSTLVELNNKKYINAIQIVVGCASKSDYSHTERGLGVQTSWTNQFRMVHNKRFCDFIILFWYGKQAQVLLIVTFENYIIRSYDAGCCCITRFKGWNLLKPSRLCIYVVVKR